MCAYSQNNFLFLNGVLSDARVALVKFLEAGRYSPFIYLFVYLFCITLPVDIFPEHYSNLLLFHTVEDLNPLSLQIACLPLNRERKFLSEQCLYSKHDAQCQSVIGWMELTENCAKINASVQLPKEFKNVGFTLKTHQIFPRYFPSTLRWRNLNATITSHCALVFQENLARKITLFLWILRCRKVPFSKWFPSKRKRKEGVFKVLRIRKR